MTEDPKYRYYLFDLGQIILERAQEAQRERAAVRKGGDEYNFHSGRVIAFNEVVSIMQQQANGFGIELNELQLENVVPDRDLI